MRASWVYFSTRSRISSLSVPVSGTHIGWERVCGDDPSGMTTGTSHPRVGPLVPREERGNLESRCGH